MNQKNSLGIDLCFKDLDNPIDLFGEWFKEAKKNEINDPNALALATASKTGIPSVRMVLLKDFNNDGFVFYTNLNSQKSNEIKSNPNEPLLICVKNGVAAAIVNPTKTISGFNSDSTSGFCWGSKILKSPILNLGGLFPCLLQIAQLATGPYSSLIKLNFSKSNFSFWIEVQLTNSNRHLISKRRKKLEKKSHETNYSFLKISILRKETNPKNTYQLRM